MRNPNAPWEIRNDAARKAWVARGRLRLTWREHVARNISELHTPSDFWLFKAFPLTPEVEEAAKTYMVD